MDRYIGLDAHSQSCTAGVMGPSGRRLSKHVLETNGAALVAFLQSIPGRLHLCIEEGTQSAWLYEILSPHVHEMVVRQVRQSDGQKSDELDAWDLADRIRTGRVGASVFKAPRQFTQLREFARAYIKLTADVVRSKNRIRALYRSRGVPTTEGVYEEGRRATWLKRLPRAQAAAAELLMLELDGLEDVRKAAETNLVQEARKHAIARVLQTAPGLGPIGVALMLPIVVTPDRFRTSRQFWAYCGLAVVTRSSSDWVPRDGRWIRAEVSQTRGLNRNRNPVLKSIFKRAAMTVAVQMKGNPLHQDYMRLLEGGTHPNLARLTIARRIAAIALSMWKHKEVYDPTRHQRVKAQ